jgi:septum formation protein
MDPVFRLASASPRRRLIFRLVAIPCTVEPAEVEETASASENARLKAHASAREAGDDPPVWTLGADTIVVLGSTIMGKPSGEAEARSSLERLSGRTHEVHTGWCLVGPGGKQVTGHAVTAVTFRKIPAKRIEDYVRAREWTDKAGGYAIQGLGAYFISRIEGDAFNVMGLPVGDVIHAFLDSGVIPRYPL